MSITFLMGQDVSLRPLRQADADGPYLEWFNDEESCRNNSHHYFPYQEQDARAFIEAVQGFRDRMVFAIQLNKDDRHIGNIELGKINWIARTGEYAIVLGDRSVWGQGLAKQASVLLLDHAFFGLNLNRVHCGTFASNDAMIRLAAFMGMREEGRRRQAIYKEGRYLDLLEFGVLRDEYEQKFEQPLSRSKVQS